MKLSQVVLMQVSGETVQQMTRDIVITVTTFIWDQVELHFNSIEDIQKCIILIFKLNVTDFCSSWLGALNIKDAWKSIVIVDVLE